MTRMAAKPCLLVVDDEPHIRLLLEQTLDDLTLRDPGTGAALRHLLGS